MSNRIQILLQTTIPSISDNWNVSRFSLLREHLSSLKDKQGNALYEVTARNREANEEGDDSVLKELDQSEFNQLWLFAVDNGDGLSIADCQGITRFRQRGGGILTTRDHQDLGSSLCTLGGLGRAHFFHTKQREPDDSRHARDDDGTQTISWPNYHSGSNGDYQKVTGLEPAQELLRNSNAASGVIEYFPAHPHEGAVGVPEGQRGASVIATGVSQVTNHHFNLLVAFESTEDDHGNKLGRAIADSSFHHFVDYNWDTSTGCPSFVLEPPGDQIRREPEKLEDIKIFVANAARWLSKT